MGFSSLDCHHPFYLRAGTPGAQRTVGCVETETPYGVQSVWFWAEEGPNQSLAEQLLASDWAVESAAQSSGCSHDEAWPERVELTLWSVNADGQWAPQEETRQEWVLSGMGLVPSSVTT